MGREHAFVLNTRMTEYKPAGHFNLVTVSSWPGPDSRRAAKSIGTRPICSGRYGADSRQSRTRNIAIGK